MTAEEALKYGLIDQCHHRPLIMTEMRVEVERYARQTR